VRSSGRIAKEIPILLIGSDLDGRLFTEPTKTVILSLHGAGIVSRHKLCPEQELVLRWPERNKEAEIRLVGQVGSKDGSYIYGVAFLDSSLNFWGVEFPPLTAAEIEFGLLPLVCNGCKTIEKINDTGIEADVCATNQGIIRFCQRCGCSTLWKPALRVVSQESLSPAAPQAPESLPSPIPSPASSSFLSGSVPASAQTSAPSPAPVCSARPASPDPVGEPLAEPGGESRAAVLTLAPPEKRAASQADRRRHPRVKVNYSARIHCPGFDEDDIVQCEDMSRGGFRFKSRKRYFEQSFIEVAVPYSPGQPAIFVPAHIVFVQELSEQQLFRYGVAYLKPTKSRDPF
jgi:PilZ domain-containing protein